MRILVLLRYGEHYVADEELTVGCDHTRFVCFELAAGGTLRVPIENLSSIEEYKEGEIEAFRTRLHQVEADRG